MGRFLALLAAGWLSVSYVCASGHFANGIKIGEVDQDSAIIWTRLTARHSLLLSSSAIGSSAGATR